MIKKIIIYTNLLFCNLVYSQGYEEKSYSLDYYQSTSNDTKQKEAEKIRKENRNLVNNEDLLSIIERKERIYLLERDVKGDKITKVEIKYDDVDDKYN